MKLLTKLFYLLSFCVVALTGCKQALYNSPSSNVYSDIPVQESVQLLQIRASQLTQAFFIPSQPLTKKEKTELVYIEESEDEDSEAHLLKKEVSLASSYIHFTGLSFIIPQQKNTDSRFHSTVIGATPLYLEINSIRI